MALHLREKNFTSHNKDRGIAWCDEGVLIIDTKNATDFLIDNRKVYIRRTEVTEDNKLMFLPIQIVEE